MLVFRTPKFVEVRWRDIRVGDLVHVRNGEEIPSDLILLSSSEPQVIESDTVYSRIIVDYEFMWPREGVLASEWLGLKIVLPCHFMNPDNDDVREFQARMSDAAQKNVKTARSILLNPGESLTITAEDLL